MDASKNCIVVGGGIAGMLASLILAKKKYKVILIEKETSLGGLLKSVEYDGAYYDYGTHLLKQTGNKELDELLFGEISENFYNLLPTLKTGTFFNGQLYAKNGFIDVTTLTEEIYKKGLLQLLEAKHDASTHTNLKEKLENSYGKTFAEEVFAKAVKKLTSEQDIALLDVNAHTLFGLGRVIVESPEKTAEWKKNPELDSKIAYHSFEEGISSLLSFYPKQGGVGAWIIALEEKLKEAGVEIRKGQYIQELKKDSENTNCIKISTGEAFTCDKLIWTLPVYGLLDLVKHPVLKSIERPKWQYSYVFHYETAEPYMKELYYYHNYDPAYRNFRVTLYKNYNGSSRSNFTVEVLSNEKLDTQLLLPIIFEEVKKQIYDNPSHVQYINAFASAIPSGFPVPTLDFVEANKRLNTIAGEEFDNIGLLGKASGNSFFMNDVLKEVYRYCENL